MSISESGGGRFALSLFGDPVVGRALMLLLQSSGYEVELLLPTSFVDAPRPLEGSSLLVLAPTPQLTAAKREAFLSLLRSDSEFASVPVLELREITEETSDEGAPIGRWDVAPWPCRIEQLERRIEAILAQHYGTRGGRPADSIAKVQ